jgi:uncharacterized protein YqgC (DUF456 family)
VTGIELAATIVVGLAMLVGVAGTLLPVLPGLLLIWAAAIVYGFLVGFDAVAGIAILASTALLGLGLYLNVRIPQKSAAESGLGIPAQLFGLLLAVVGFFVVPVVGFPLGFVLGVFIVRYQATRDTARAWISTKKSIGAIVRASAVQAACGLGMFAVWMLWAASVAIQR